jgi:Flp pilus assembly protein TadG
MSLKFKNDRKGSISIVFALSGLIVFGITGAAIDFGRGMTVRNQLQQAADAAAMAAAMAKGDEAYKQQVGIDTFRANLLGSEASGSSSGGPANLGGSSGGNLPTPSVVVNPTNITVTATAFIKPILLQLAGITSLSIDAQSVAVTTGKKLELAMMLDTTGSMCSGNSQPCTSGTKLDAMKAAAKDLLDIVMPSSAANSKAAIVPFASYVRVSATNTTQLTGRTDYPNSVCTLERKRGPAVSEEPPTLNVNEFWIRTSNSDCSNTSPIQPLTNDRNVLNTVIDGLKGYGATAGHLGTQWAWHAISPQWTSRWPAGSAPVAYTDAETIKAVVLMTDGNYTEMHRDANGNDPGCNGSSDCSQSRTRAKAICTEMKTRLNAQAKQAILIFTVGFGLEPESTTDGQNARNTLIDCASIDPHDPAQTRKLYYFPYTSEEMRNAFKDIGRALSEAVNAPRLSN